MKIQKFAKDLQKGDLIAVPYNNYLSAAIYLDEGKWGNPRFIGLWRYGTREHMENMLKINKLYKDYIVRDRADIIAKLHVDNMDKEVQQMYWELYDLLKKYGKI